MKDRYLRVAIALLLLLTCSFVKAEDWFEYVLKQRAAAKASGKKAEVPGIPDFRGSFTAVVWIRTKRDGSVLAITKTGEWSKNCKSLFIQDGRLALDIGWVGCMECQTRVNDGKWHCIALVGGEEPAVYVDGKRDNEGSLDVPKDPKGTFLSVGFTNKNFPEDKPYFKGHMDELQVYNRRLSGVEIQSLAKKTDAKVAGLVRRWSFEENLTESVHKQTTSALQGSGKYIEGIKGKGINFNGESSLRGEGTSGGGKRSLADQIRGTFADDKSKTEITWCTSAGILTSDTATVPSKQLLDRFAEALGKSLPVKGDVTDDHLRKARKAFVSAQMYADLKRGLAELEKMSAKKPQVAKKYKAQVDGFRKSGDFSAYRKLQFQMSTSASQMVLEGFDKILFVKRYTFHSTHYYTDFIDGCSRLGGNLCVLDMKTGMVTDLLPQMSKGIFGRFDLHFSAKKVVFDWKEKHGVGFRIYEVDIDPKRGVAVGKPRQLTRPPKDEAARIKKYRFVDHYHHQTDDMHPCYLPDGGIMFTSSRCEYGVLCNPEDNLTVTVLHRMDGDGRNMRQLTRSPLSEFSPAVMEDGRILYSRWEYVDKGQLGVKCLWSMKPDGSGSAEVYGNNIQYPPTLLHGRQIPGEPNKFVFLGTPHYPQSGMGTVIVADTTKNIRTREPMTFITPHIDIRQEGGWNHLQNGRWTKHQRGPLYVDPYPLTGKDFLVSYNPDKQWNHPRAYGLYLLSDGKPRKLYVDNQYSCFVPHPLRPRKRPPIIPSTLNPQLASKKLAHCIVQDIYHGLDGIKRGEVKYIRVMEQMPRPWDARRFWQQGSGHTDLIGGGSLSVKAMWGVVPVEKDGSASFYVPANRNIYFQALDKDYMEVQRERTYVNYMPGEQRSCVGCHETPNDAPPTRMGVPIAMKRAPNMPGPQPGDKTGKQAIHFPTYVQPVLDKHCIKCHGGNRGKGPNEGGEFDLRGTLTAMHSKSFEALHRRDAAPNYNEGSDWEGTEYRPPKSIGSHKSPMIRALLTGKQHKDLKLPQSAFVRLATWVDAGGVYYGSWWGRRNARYRKHPFFRPNPTFEEAISFKCKVPVSKR